MKSSQRPSTITRADLLSKASTYSSIVPETLESLDQIRLTEIPETLAQRKNDGDAFLEKSELISLVEWKLKHGTYRPTLASLIASNPPSTIISTTTAAFNSYTPTSPTHSLTLLTKLRGVGPATASLLLSCYDPSTAPFFSDELFRWMSFEDGKGSGWDRRIGYSMKEYRELVERVGGLRERLGMGEAHPVTALEVEKAAYVIARESRRRGVGEDEGEMDKQRGVKGPMGRGVKRRKKDGVTAETPKKRKKADQEDEKDSGDKND